MSETYNNHIEAVIGKPISSLAFNEPASLIGLNGKSNKYAIDIESDSIVVDLACVYALISIKDEPLLHKYHFNALKSKIQLLKNISLLSFII